MSELRIIKKYPNRRLYDTHISSYITLENVKTLVLQKVAFKVIDARSNKDLTHSTLLQIINESEESSAPIFTNNTLQDVIRFYGNPMQNLMSDVIEQSISLFLKQQEALASHMETGLKPNSYALSSTFFKDDIALWKERLTQTQLQEVTTTITHKASADIAAVVDENT